MSFLYSAYGLRLRSNLPIIGLIDTPTLSEIDVNIFLGYLPSPPDRAEAEDCVFISDSLDEDGESILRVWKDRSRNRFRFRYSDATEFVVDERGENIWARW